jgi:hypothetical protein
VPAFRLQHSLDPSGQGLVKFPPYGLKHDLIVKKNLLYHHFECVNGVNGVNLVCPFKYLFFDNSSDVQGPGSGVASLAPHKVLR